MMPDWALMPMVVLATAATVIASQAVITGAYSLSQQAIQLGLLPRLEIRHTSATQSGQIYMPRVNMLLLVGVLLLVGLFRSSSALAAAYGIAVTGTMVVTAIAGVCRRLEGLEVAAAGRGALMVPFPHHRSRLPRRQLSRFVEGGWFPLALGAFMMLIMLTWRRGTRIFRQDPTARSAARRSVRTLEKQPPHTVPGTAVFLTGDPTSAPTALLHSLKHYKVLHEHNVILTICDRRHAAGSAQRTGDDGLDLARLSRA